MHSAVARYGIVVSFFGLLLLWYYLSADSVSYSLSIRVSERTNFAHPDQVDPIRTAESIDEIAGDRQNLGSHRYDCRSIIGGRIAEIRRAERWQPPPSSNFTCLDPRLDPPLLRDPGAESDFPLAFSILAYKNPDQLHRLLRTIYRPWNSYCIHLDSKADRSMVDLLTTITQCHGNIRTSPRRYNVTWGEPSLLHAALSCQQLLHSETSPDWIYLLNIAASDFPLLPNSDMIRVLRSLNGSSDVQITELRTTDAWKYRYSFANPLGYEVAIKELKASMASYDRRTFPTKAPPPFGLRIWKGSFSGAFHRGFVDFILTDPVARGFLDYLEDAFIADEAYWATLYVYFARTNNMTVQRDFRTRYTHWGNRRPSCGGYYEHGLCVFGVRDLRWLLESPRFFFAHKFDEKQQPMALECLEEHISNKMRS